MNSKIPAILQTIRAGRGDWNDPSPITQGEADTLANEIDSMRETILNVWRVLESEAHDQADVLFEALRLNEWE